MSRFTKEHYEDVALVLKENRAWAIQMDRPHARAVMASTIGQFADLFAADNPRKCRGCGLVEDINNALHQGYDWGGGFNRVKFLTACGLQPSEPPHLGFHQ